jgi:hypothetical protein
MTSETIGIIGVALLTTGIYVGAAEHLWLRRARIADGTVIELIRSKQSHTRGAARPRIRFRAADHSIHEFTRNYSTSPHGFTVGQRLLVAYSPETFEGRIVTFGQRFGFASIFASAGIGLLLLAALFAVGHNLLPRIYEKHRATLSEETRRA